MRIYISLPISNCDEKAQREKADKIKMALSRKGHQVVNPFEIYAGENPKYIDYLLADLRALNDCDAIYLCKGWQQSKGCQLEREFAELYRKRLMFESVEPVDVYWR